MTNVVLFTPKSELDKKQNLQDFLNFAKQLPPLSQEMDYDSNYWKGIVNFTKLGVNARDKNPENLLHPSIIPFAKAYVIYCKSVEKTKNTHQLKAIRVIEKAILQRHPDIDVTQIDSNVLDRAAQIALETYGTGSYQAGCHLEKLQTFLVNKKIVEYFSWKNPIKRPEDTIEKVGEKGKEARDKRLPDEDALLAIAEIFALGEENLSPRDIFITSTITLLLSAPARGSEPLYLKTDCLHYDKDKDGNPAVGLKWYSGKGYGYEVKWIASAMVPCTEEAVKRLKNLSSESREYAISLEKSGNPNTQRRASTTFPYIDFKRAPEITLKWSDALYVYFFDQFNLQRKTNKTRLWIPTINTLNEDLAKTKKTTKNSDDLVNVLSLFERHNYPSHYKVTSHQLRHLLSTIAKVNGMEDELHSKWAGRADAKQNRIYNHKTPEQYNQQYRQHLDKYELSSNENGFRHIQIADPNSIQELNTQASLTAHFTEFGMCVHDYIMTPCAKHRDCVNCVEQVCVKGNDEKLARLKTKLEREKALLDGDKKAVDDELIGADKHYQKRVTTIARCEELIAALTNDDIPDGSLIRLNIEDISSLDHALDINNKKRLPKIEKNRGLGVEQLKKAPRALEKLKQLRAKNNG